ncbi:MAG TPA: hypothetical protein VF796_21860 [Humisphaera sp.]
MQRFGLRKKIHGGLQAYAWIAGIVGVVVTATVSADLSAVKTYVPSLADGLAWAKMYAWFVGPVLTVTSGAAALTRHYIGEPWVWTVIHGYLDLCREFVFRARKGEPLDHHRVTLFRRYGWWHYPCCFTLPCGAKLMPVERSGHTSQKSNAAFRAPDAAERAEGVVGQAWRIWQTIPIHDLPLLTADSSDDEIRAYASRTWVTERWVRSRLERGKTLSRAICAIPVRVKGLEWGVLVIDSLDPKSLEDADAALYDLLGRSFGMLLERV